MSATLEHANITVTDPAKTAAWMKDVFGWHIRWEGDAISGGHTKHVGAGGSYLALYRSSAEKVDAAADSYTTVGALNHLAVIVEDIDRTETAVVKQGFKPVSHGNYDPGRRFYFHDSDGIEYEVVSYDQHDRPDPSHP